MTLGGTDSRISMSASNPLGITLEVLQGHVFLQTDAHASHKEGAPALGLFGSSAGFTADARLFDLVESGGVVEPFAPVSFNLEFAPHVGATLASDPLLIPVLISQRSVSDNGYPIQKTIAHAINPPRLSDLINGQYWEHTLVFVDMCGYQEVDFALHLGALKSVAKNNGGLEEFWSHSVFDRSVSARSTHTRGLPFYVRGALRVRMRADIGISSTTLPRSVVCQPRSRYNAQPGRVLSTEELICAFPTTEDSSVAMQQAMTAYIEVASSPYRLAGAAKPQDMFGMFTPAWTNFIVPQYMSVTGVEMPASAMAMGLVYPTHHHTLEAFFEVALEDVCEQLELNKTQMVQLLEEVSRVYGARRENAFRTDPTKAPRVSGEQAPALLTHGAVDMLVKCVETVFVETCTALSYTTDTTDIVPSLGGGTRSDTRFGRVLRKMAPNGVMEVERITADLLRCVGFDCEDGSMFNYRLHTLLCVSRFEYKSPLVRAFAHVMDLYMPCVAKMQCGGNPEHGETSSLVCHILSWLILRDEAYRMMMDGSQYASRPEVGLDMTQRNAKAAAARTAFLDPVLYEGSLKPDAHMKPLEYEAQDTPHYPLPIMLCLEPTAPVVSSQMPCDAHYSDMSTQEHAKSRSNQTMRVANTERAAHIFGNMAAPPPVMKAFPHPGYSVAQARREPFTKSYSPFYRGVISFWMPDSTFLLRVQKQRGSTRAQRALAASGTGYPVALDYVCALVDSNGTGPERLLFGVPHNIFVTHGNRAGAESDGRRVVLIPTTPIKTSLCSLMARVVACEPCPESPQIMPGARSQQLAARCMPNIAALATPPRDQTGASRGGTSRRRSVSSASRRPGKAQPRRAVVTSISPTSGRGASELAALLKMLDSKTTEDSSSCVRVCPADAHMFFEREIATALERALSDKTIAAIQVHASPIGRPQFQRVRPILPPEVCKRICALLEVDASSALTFQRLSMLCGDALYQIMREGSSNHKYAQLQTILGENASMTHPDRQALLVRAVAQYLLDRGELTRFVIVLHMYEHSVPYAR